MKLLNLLKKKTPQSPEDAVAPVPATGVPEPTGNVQVLADQSNVGSSILQPESMDMQVGMSEPIFRLPAWSKFLIFGVYALFFGCSAYFVFSYWSRNDISKLLEVEQQAYTKAKTRKDEIDKEQKLFEDCGKRKDNWLPIYRLHQLTYSSLLAKILDCMPQTVRLTSLSVSKMDVVGDSDQKSASGNNFKVSLGCQIIAKDKAEVTRVVSEFQRGFRELTKFDITKNTSVLKTHQQATYRGKDAVIFHTEEEWIVEAPLPSEDDIYAQLPAKKSSP